MELLPTVEGRTLVFVETKRQADALEEFLYNEDGQPLATTFMDRFG